MSSNSNKNPLPKATVITTPSVIDIVDPTGTLEANQIKQIEDLVEKASVLHKEIDIEQGKTAIKIVWQGCHLYVVDDTLTVIEDEKIREEIYGKLLEKYGIARKTADQRVLLVKRMLEKKTISRKLLFSSEENAKPSGELMAQLEKVCGNKKAVDLQREHGIRQPLKDKPEKVITAKPLNKQFEEKAKRINSTLVEMGKLAADNNLGNSTLVGLSGIYVDLGKAVMHFQKILIDKGVNPEPDVPADALVAINSPVKSEELAKA